MKHLTKSKFKLVIECPTKIISWWHILLRSIIKAKIVTSPKNPKHSLQIKKSKGYQIFLFFNF